MKQITSRISDLSYAQISNIADETDRSVSYVISALIDQALKEKKRLRAKNRKDAKEDPA